ncbi:MAG: TorF family putative porin [Methylococcales bacterium]|nr:TorF family putative porin [Methylococcales bacterium]
MNTIKATIAITILTTSLTSVADEDNSFYGFTPSASVALTTDYIWRGVSQTNNEPAIQGAFDLSHETGLYVGAWASSYEFANNATMELDVYGGFTNETNFAGLLPFDLTYDLGILRYEYTSASDAGFTELYFGGSTSPIKNLNISTYYYYGLKIDHTHPGEYTDMSVDYTLPDSLGGITILGHAGFYNQKAGLDNYWDWKVGVAKDIGGFNFEVAYVDTDGSGANASGGTGRPLDDARVVATISRELGGSSASSSSMLPEGFESSASVALTTDYIWRGVSQTNNDPAIQGSFDIAHKSGAYIGLWGSSFNGSENASSMELDVYAGFSRETTFGDLIPFGLTYDLGVLRYEYTAESALNFTELYFGASIEPVKNLNISTYYYYGLKVEHTHPGEYTDMSVDYTLPEQLGSIKVLAHAGYYNQKAGADDYWDWKAGVARDFGAFNVEVAYTETDNANDSNLSDSHVVATLSTTF